MTAKRQGRDPNVDRINAFLQAELRRRDLDSVRAVEAARWLDSAGILRDSRDRPGLPLRYILRKGEITGQRRENGRWWFIDRGKPQELLPRQSQELVDTVANPNVRAALNSLIETILGWSQVRYAKRPTKQRGIVFHRGSTKPADRFLYIYPGKSLQFFHRGELELFRNSTIALGPDYARLPIRELPAKLDYARTLARTGYELVAALPDDVAKTSSLRAVPYSPSTSPPGQRRDPWTVDPDKLDRATAAHKRIEREIERTIRAHGHSPIRVRGGVEFDIGWISEGCLNCVEVKSLSRRNQTKQLRLGLGQILDYRAQLSERGYHSIRGILAVQSRPTDARWERLTASLDVTLTWPSVLDQLFAPESAKESQQKGRGRGISRTRCVSV